MTQAARPTKVTSGGNHHRSVRNVFAVIAARVRPARSSAGPVGLVAVVVIRSPDVPCPSDPAVNGRRSPTAAMRRDVWHTLRLGSDTFWRRDDVYVTNPKPARIDMGKRGW